jgi:hypothetical protein
MYLRFWCIEGLVGVSEVDANRTIIPQELGTRRLKRGDKIISFFERRCKV